jgi:hypothetical protein
VKVLVATTETQGWRENDFCAAVEDELVLFVPFQCASGSIDDGCGCRRAMAGSVSHRATTTVKVLERNDLTRDSYLVLITDSLESQGYVSQELMRKPEVTEWVEALTDDLIRIAARFPAGTVLERRGELMRLRLPS